MRLIDAERLAKEIDRAWTLWQKKGENCYIFSDVITPLLVSQPTIEPNRPHGEWVLDKEFSFVFNMYECSKCRFNGSKRWHFCPNCGADMRKEGD